MSYQGSSGRAPLALLAPPIAVICFERVAALAANTFVWLIIAKIILSA